MTGLLATCASQFADWTAAYRLFSRERFDARTVLDSVLAEVLALQPDDAPVVAAVDDTLLHKRGTKMAATSWRRDPLGPPFSTNLVRAQRVLQLSAALPCGDGSARLVPVDMVQAPSPAKPRRAAPVEAWEAYRAGLRASRLGLVAAQRVAALRERVDGMPGAAGRTLLLVGDGGYTNGTLLGALPKRTVFIGRIRADAKLYELPAPVTRPGRGRPRAYGAPVPTPDEIRRDEAVPWQRVRVWAAGQWHDFKIKTMAPLRWRVTSDRYDLRLVVIAPLGYRPSRSAKVSYRHPAYLICTDPSLSLERLLQAYVWRSEIEVNFRDEKTLLGVGQAQVRTAASVQTVPALLVAAYATLLVAAARAFGPHGRAGHLPPAKWRRSQPPRRMTTQELLKQLRAELWAKALGLPNFSDFASHLTRDAKSDNLSPHLASTVLYACG